MNKHKDLPPASQAWANEMDALAEENKQLKEVVRRLCENAGLDYSNPKRGINGSTDIPSNANPVGQKLSSLADVQTYDVADKQVLNWSQKDQRWLPVTLPTSSGGVIPIPMAYYGDTSLGVGQIDTSGEFIHQAYHSTRVSGGGFTTYGFAESWGGEESVLGAGDQRASNALVNPMYNGGDPTISLYVYSESADAQCQLFIQSNNVRVDFGTFQFARVSATRPRPPQTVGENPGGAMYDTTIGKPIWWNGTEWTDALGTAV